ncbi:MAG: type II toxin-antitoxin system antitoxin, RelB/DinJ family [Candidatus Hydrogenedentota bacterium]|nr:MAG: type II toxin-antitoxin system antitoxin, RelB/DinJ family [Candidatus Hydrogenedentota bacterium]
MSTEPTSLRLDADAKKAAYAIFDEVGLKPAQAINLFLHQVVLTRGIPFPIAIPNASTLDAMKELDQNSGKHFNNNKEFYDDLGM